MERVLQGRKLRPGQKRGDALGKTRRGKRSKWMVVVDGKGFPLGNHPDSVSPAEVTPVEKTLNQISVPKPGGDAPRRKPDRLIYDKAADSDQLRPSLRKRGIVLVAPHRVSRKKRKTRDGRKLRRYPRKWIVETTFAWLAAFRRLVRRYDRSLLMYNAFFHVACMIITLRQL